MTSAPPPSGPDPSLPDRRSIEMIRSEERLTTSTVRAPTTRVRLRKRIVTETRTLTVQVSREEFVQEQVPIDPGEHGHEDAGREGDGGEPDSGPPAPEEIEIVLHEQRPVITFETVAVERIRIRTRVVTEDQTITTTIRKEQIELHHDPAPGTPSERLES